MEFDEEIVREVMDSFNDLYTEIDGLLVQLSDHGADDPDQLHALFRAVHSVKGNAAMLQVDPIVHFTHALEEIVDSLRAGRYPLTRLICEVLHLGMDRVRDLHHRDIMGLSSDNLQEETIGPLMKQMAEKEPSEIELAAYEVLAAFGVEMAVAEHAPEQKTAAVSGNVVSVALGDERRRADLDLFRSLAAQVDQQSQFWEGRTQNIFSWAQKLNEIAGSPVDSQQLAAAIYMHDIGMAFVPSRILDKEGKLNAEEVAQIRHHPTWGHGLLSRMPGWDEAARMVHEHQEHFDGKGYPQALAAESIHPGARILAVIDAFFSITNGRADRSQRRSVVRAVSELNARSGSQFDPAWVSAFNDLVKAEIKAGNL